MFTKELEGFPSQNVTVATLYVTCWLGMGVVRVFGMDWAYLSLGR